MKILLSAAAAAVAITFLAGCSGDDDGDARDTATDTASTTPTSDPTAEPTVGTYPELDAEDYTYVLEQVCFCPVSPESRLSVSGRMVTAPRPCTNPLRGRAPEAKPVGSRATVK